MSWGWGWVGATWVPAPDRGLRQALRENNGGRGIDGGGFFGVAPLVEMVSPVGSRLDGNNGGRGIDGGGFFGVAPLVEMVSPVGSRLHGNDDGGRGCGNGGGETAVRGNDGMGVVGGLR